MGGIWEGAACSCPLHLGAGWLPALSPGHQRHLCPGVCPASSPTGGAPKSPGPHRDGEGIHGSSRGAAGEHWGSQAVGFGGAGGTWGVFMAIRVQRAVYGAGAGPVLSAPMGLGGLGYLPGGAVCWGASCTGVPGRCCMEVAARCAGRAGPWVSPRGWRRCQGPCAWKVTGLGEAQGGSGAGVVAPHPSGNGACR